MTIYYVAQLAAGTGDGSSYANRMSVVSHNARSFSAGDTIYLCDTIPSRLTIPSSGAAGNRITYRGDYAGHAGILTANSSFGSLRGVTKNYMVIDGVEIKNGKIGISFMNNCNYITIKKCVIHDMGTAGSKGILISSDANPKERNSNIIIGGALGDGNEIYNVGVDTGGGDVNLAHIDNVTVSYNKLYGGEKNTGIDGVALTVCNEGIIEYNEIYDHIKSSSVPVAQFGEDGIDLKGSTNTIVRYNHIYGNRILGISVNYSDAMSANCSNISIYGNCVHDHRTNIAVKDLDNNCYIWGNLIYNSTNGHGISCTMKGSGVHIYNNTLINNHGDGTDFAILISQAGSNYYVKNNILYSDTHNDLMYIVSASNVNLDYNRHFYDGGAMSRVYWNGIYRTLPELQALGQETNGTEGDPGLTNIGAGDFTLTVVSACRDAGLNLGTPYNAALNPLTTDFKTSPPTVNTADQGVGWDVGAFMYTIGALAEGRIVSLTHPESVENGAMCDINAAIKNIGTAAGIFKTQILIDSILFATSAEFTLAGGATSADKIDPFKAPSSGESMDITIKCIRSE